jgi:UDP-N-acetylmuramate dehydrogenase
MSELIIQKNIPLKPYHTFGIDVKAKYFVNIQTMDELDSFTNNFDKIPQPVYFLGGGANTLFTKDFEGTVIRNTVAYLELEKENEEYVEFTVGAGVIWDDFVQFCVENDFYGIENLSAIPGHVGGAAIQNIGAYGVEAGQYISGVTYSDLAKNEVCYIGNKECQFAYRDSIFKHELAGKYIMFVHFRLPKEKKLVLSYGRIKEELAKDGISDPGIEDVSKIIRKIRASKLPDPAEYGNAGSFFKNPVIEWEHYLWLKEKYPDMVAYELEDGNIKVAAAWLIDHLGWKGRAHKGAAVHDKQALVLINKNNAKGSDIVELSQMIRDDVQKHFDIDLEAEVKIL